MTNTPVICLSSDGGSSYLDPGVAMADANALAYAASGTYSMRAKLDSLAGTTADDIEYSFTTADDLHNASLPAMTRVGADVTFSLPKTGGAWILKCLVNNDETLESELKICVRNAANLQQFALGETTQAGAYGWLTAANEIARALASFGSAPPTGTGIPHIVGGVYNGAASPIVNADVSATAAIAGNKIVPTFGAQTATAQWFDATDAASVLTSNASIVVSIDPTYGPTFGDTSGAWGAVQLAVDGGRLRLRSVSVPVGIAAGGSLVGLETGQDGDSTCIAIDPASGSNVAGGDLAILGGKGTGNASPGRVKVYLATAGSSGSTVQSWSTTPVLDVEANGGAPCVRGLRFQGISGQAFNTGHLSVSVAGSGAVTLGSGSIEAHALELTGVLTGDRDVTLPATEGASWIVVNNTTGNHVLTVTGGGKSHVLARGQEKEVWHDGSNLSAVDPYSFVYRATVSLVGSVGNVDTALAKLPAGLSIRSCGITTKTGPTGGTSTLSLGTTSGGAELLAATASGATGTVIGEDTGELGSAWSATTIGVYSSSARTLYLRNAIATADITDGEVYVEVIGVLKDVVQ